MGTDYPCGCRQAGVFYKLCGKHEDELMMKINPPIIPRNRTPSRELQAIITKARDNAHRETMRLMPDPFKEHEAEMVDIMKAVARGLQGPIKPRSSSEVEADYIERKFQK